VNVVINLPGLRANANWRRLWLGQAASLIGDSVFDITMLLWVAQVLAKGRTWAPGAASGVLVAQAGAVLIVGPIAGVFVDRWDRRRTMMTADVLRAALVAALLALPAFGHNLGAMAELAAVYLVVAAQSALAQFFNPARLATLGRIVSPADQAQASSMLQATGSLTAIVGPPLAAPLLFAFGVQWALIINAASFAVSFLAIRSIRMPDQPSATRAAHAGLRTEFRTGIRFFRSNHVLIALSAGVTIATLGTGALNALMVFFITGDLHTAAKWLGILFAAIGSGEVVGALLTGWVAKRIGATLVFSLSLMGGGILLAAFSCMKQFPPAIFLGALVGLAFGAINTAAPPLLLANIPQHMIGRIMAIFNPLQQLAGVLAMVTAGFLASGILANMKAVIAGVSFGAINTIFGVSAILILMAGVITIAPLRRAGGPQLQAAIHL
jgi:MFS family permease